MMYYIDVYTTLYSECKGLDNLTTGKAGFIAFTSQVRKTQIYSTVTEHLLYQDQG